MNIWSNTVQHALLLLLLILLGWLGVRKSIQPVKKGICLEWGADCLHMVQLMPLHPWTTLSLASFKCRLVLTFWYWLTQVDLAKRPLNRCSTSSSSSRSQNQQMNGSWICYVKLRVWCNCNILWLDSSPCPPFLGRWGNCSKFCQRCDGAFIRRVCGNQMAERVKTGKYSFNRGVITRHFGENAHVSFYPFWGTVVDVFGVPSGLLLVYGVSRNSIPLVTLSVNCYVYRLFVTWYSIVHVCFVKLM